MNGFKGRFFVPIFLVFITFSAIYAKEINFIFFILFAAILGVIYVIFGRSRARNANFRILLLLMLCAALLGTVRASLYTLSETEICKGYSGDHVVKGYVTEVLGRTEYLSEATVHVESVDGEAVSFDVITTCEVEGGFERGDFVSLRATLVPFSEYWSGDEGRAYEGLGCPLVASVPSSDCIELCEGTFRARLALSSLNSRLSAILRSTLGARHGSLASALLLGNRDLLSESVLRDFRRAGVYHMLALSGMHVAILVGALGFLLKRLFVPKRIRVIILALCSIFYVALTGFLLSACRAMLMLWAVYIAYLLGRRGDSMTSLLLAVSVIVLITPSAVYDVGLMLSFASTFGVIASAMIAGRISQSVKMPKRGTPSALLAGVTSKLAGGLLASLCVTICTLPIVSYYFGELSLATFISNIFMGTVCECFMILAIITLILSALGSSIILHGVVALTSTVGSLMTGICSFISDIDGIVISLNYPLIPIATVLLTLSSLILFGIRLERLWRLAIPCMCFAVLLPISALSVHIMRADSARAEYIAGDALVLSTASEIYICDASNGRGNSLYDAMELASRNCFTEIDGIVLTHYHSYHAVTLGRLCSNYRIDRIHLPLPQNDEELTVMRSILRILDEMDVSTYLFSAGDALDLLGGELLVSDRAYGLGYSHPSVAVSFSFGDSKLTLVERPTFGTHLETSGRLAEHLRDSDVVIFGSDGRAPRENYSVFPLLPEGCEIHFSDFDLMELSDLESGGEGYEVYFSTEYKKYDLK